MNMAQQTSLLKDILIPLGGALATLAAGFGGVFLGTKLTDKRRKDEERQNNINKSIYLYHFTEKYLINLLDYKNRYAAPRIAAIKNNDYATLYRRPPYASYNFSITIDDYSFIINENSSLLTVLYMLIHHSIALDSVIKEFIDILSDKTFLQKFDSTTVDKKSFDTRINSLATAINDTCNDVIFFAHLLCIHLSILIMQRYKQDLTCADEIVNMKIEDSAKHNPNDLSSWITGLSNSWKK